MITYDLPTSVEIGGQNWEIEWDYRAALDICCALNDPDMDDTDRTLSMLLIFYKDFESMPPEFYDEAVQKCLWFLGCDSKDDKEASPRMLDWEHDYPVIAPAINRVAGRDIRAPGDKIHWWTFVGWYQEIGDCMFAQILRIRDMLRRGKRLDKSDMEFYERNKALIDLPRKYTPAENEMFDKWIV